MFELRARLSVQSATNYIGLADLLPLGDISASSLVAVSYVLYILTYILTYIHTYVRIYVHILLVIGKV